MTLTGPGGTGKTRLSIAAATELVPEFHSGVFWIPLAALRDPALVPVTIAQTIGAKTDLRVHIGAREMLLVLDNFEQVIGAAPFVSQIVSECPNLKVLTTSRELLRVEGEVEYAVPPLDRDEAVELFCHRSRSPADPSVTELCARLDDLPLAVELAAARVKVLTPEGILDRLGERLDLLRGGRDADPRQTTLRATIEWSYDLLPDREKALFARLAVFRGGWTFAASGAVANADLETLQSLIEKSLVRRNENRFFMLETIRNFAVERLEVTGDRDDVRGRHYEHFLAVAEGAYEERYSDASKWLPIIDVEHDNVRAALAWAESHDGRTQATLAGAVAYFWVQRGYAIEARDNLERAIRAHDVADAIRARALTELADAVGLIGEDQRAVAHAEEAARIWGDLGDPKGEAQALEFLGRLFLALGDRRSAASALERSLDLRRRTGAADLVVAQSLAALCQLRIAENKANEAEVLARELLEVGSATRSARVLQWGLHYLAISGFVSGDHALAERRFVDSLVHARRAGLLKTSTEELLGVAVAAAATGRFERAIELAAAVHKENESLGTLGTTRFWVELEEQYLGRARAELGEEATKAAEAAGRSRPFDEILDAVAGDA